MTPSIVLLTAAACRDGGGCCSDGQGPLRLCDRDRVGSLQTGSRGESGQGLNEGREALGGEIGRTLQALAMIFLSAAL